MCLCNKMLTDIDLPLYVSLPVIMINSMIKIYILK